MGPPTNIRAKPPFTNKNSRSNIALSRVDSRCPYLHTSSFAKVSTRDTSLTASGYEERRPFPKSIPSEKFGDRRLDDDPRRE